MVGLLGVVPTGGADGATDQFPPPRLVRPRCAHPAPQPDERPPLYLWAVRSRRYKTMSAATRLWSDGRALSRSFVMFQYRFEPWAPCTITTSIRVPMPVALRWSTGW